jgi:hypothetical protein
MGLAPWETVEILIGAGGIRPEEEEITAGTTDLPTILYSSRRGRNLVGTTPEDQFSEIIGGVSKHRDESDHPQEEPGEGVIECTMNGPNRSPLVI